MEFSICAALSDRPMFAEPIPNVTVPLGRDVSLPCVVENLGNYKVIKSKNQCHIVLCSFRVSLIYVHVTLSLSLSFSLSLRCRKASCAEAPFTIARELDSIQQVLSKISYVFFRLFVVIKRSEITR